LVQKLNPLVLGFMVILIGIILLSVTADQIFLSRTVGTTTNESMTMASNAGQTVNVELGVYDVTYFGNHTDTIVSDNVSTTNSVNFTEAGVITTGGSVTDGVYNITYNYYPDEYVQSGTGRTLINLIVIFFALGVVFLGIKFFNEMREF